MIAVAAVAVAVAEVAAAVVVVVVVVVVSPPFLEFPAKSCKILPRQGTEKKSIHRDHKIGEESLEFRLRNNLSPKFGFSPEQVGFISV